MLSYAALRYLIQTVSNLGNFKLHSFRGCRAAADYVPVCWSLGFQVDYRVKYMFF
jgi:hypothetical protein